MNWSRTPWFDSPGIAFASASAAGAAAGPSFSRTYPTRLRTSGSLCVANLPTSAAYFVACEALTNAVRYASASRVAMRAVRQNGTLLVSITDDGIGGAVVRRGSGLAGLQDRVAAHGGTLEVVSPRGRGTRVEVAIPCES